MEAYVTTAQPRRTNSAAHAESEGRDGEIEMRRRAEIQGWRGVGWTNMADWDERRLTE